MHIQFLGENKKYNKPAALLFVIEKLVYRDNVGYHYAYLSMNRTQFDSVSMSKDHVNVSKDSTCPSLINKIHLSTIPAIFVNGINCQ